MGDASFPSQHTTTTTVTSNTRVNTSIRYDPTYIRSIDGIIKVVQLALGWLGFICIQCTRYSIHASAKFFSTVSMLGVWITTFLLLGYLFHIIEKFYRIPWVTFELFFCGIIALMYLICSCMVVTLGVPAFEAAAFFGFSAMVVYAVDAFLKYKMMREGQLAQGERDVVKQTSAATSPGWNVA